MQCSILPRSNTVQQPIEDVIVEFEANPLWKEMTRLKQAVLNQIMRKEHVKETTIWPLVELLEWDRGL